MKQIYFGLLFCFSVTVFSQEDILGEWFLYNIQIDGINYNNTFNDDFNIIFSEITETLFSINGEGVCNSYWSNYSTLGTDQIEINNCGITLLFCVGHDFEIQHLYEIYCNYDNNINEVLSYSIVGNGTEETLTVTNTSNNNFAVYGRQRLSTTNYDLSNTSILLKNNPVKEQLEFAVTGKKSLKFNYQLYSLDGKLISIGLINDQEKIDVAHLVQGIYFVTIGTTNNQKQTFKFLKE